MAERVHVHCSSDTRMSPGGVIAALTDFTDRRTELWPNIDPAKYRVHEVGADWARVTEGNVEPDIWALERYSRGPEWLSIKAEESNFCCAGDGTDLRITHNAEGGSHIELDWEREAASPEWEPVIAIMGEQGEAILGISRPSAQIRDSASIPSARRIEAEFGTPPGNLRADDAAEDLRAVRHLTGDVQGGPCHRVPMI